MMKQKTDKLTKLFIFNVLLLALAVVITINLLETSGARASQHATPVATQTVS